MSENVTPLRQPLDYKITEHEVETLANHLFWLADKDAIPRQRQAIVARLAAEKMMQAFGIQLEPKTPPAAPK